MADLLDKATGYQPSLEKIRELFNNKNWKFLKTEFSYEHLDDKEFIDEIKKNWESPISENYYSLSHLSSSIKFNSIALLIQHVIENKLEIISDLD